MRPQTASPHAGLHTALRRRAHERRRAAAASNLTRRQEEEQLTAAAFYVPHLLGVPADSTLKLYSGLIPSSPPEAPDKSDAHLFFVLARNRHIADKERLIIWFNGGPGCSSFDGFLMEIGPLRTVPGSTTGELREVDGAWNEYANVLFRYSYVQTDGMLHELPDAAAQVVEFLRRFYQVFPEFATMETYLAGESYAGQYIPYTADAILSTTVITPPLKGVMIGNGWIDPVAQYSAYRDFALQNGVVKEGTAAAKRVDEAHEQCQKSLSKYTPNNVPVHESTCEGVLSTILDTTRQTVNGETLCINTYDVRLTDTHPACGMNWPPDLKTLYQYLPREDVKASFHASAHEGGWIECSGTVGSNFYTATSRPAVELLPKLLEKINVLLFDGDQDLICNWFGHRAMLESLEWNGQKGFTSESQQLDWQVDGKHAGTWRTERNLSFVLIANASHMAPFDVPLVTHDMLIRFIAADLISAAGPAAKIPSRIGEEQEAVISHTHVNGTALGAEDVDVPVVESGAETIRETYYNFASAAVLLFLVICCVGIFFYLRNRIFKAQQEHAYDLPPAPTAKRRSRSKHTRTESMASFASSTRSTRRGRASDSISDPTELHELVVERPEEEAEKYEPRRAPLRDSQTIFSVGEEGDEDEEGDMGRQEPEKPSL